MTYTDHLYDLSFKTAETQSYSMHFGNCKLHTIAVYLARVRNYLVFTEL